MTKDELIEKLMLIKKRQVDSDEYAGCYQDHVEADALLLEYIGIEEVTKIFDSKDE